MKKEMDQIKEHKTFADLDKGARIPKGHQKTCVHVVWDCKFDLRRKARLVSSGNLTPPSSDNACSGIVSLEGARTVLFLARNRKTGRRTDSSFPPRSSDSGFGGSNFDLPRLQNFGHSNQGRERCAH